MQAFPETSGSSTTSYCFHVKLPMDVPLLSLLLPLAEQNACVAQVDCV